VAGNDSPINSNFELRDCGRAALECFRKIRWFHPPQLDGANGRQTEQLLKSKGNLGSEAFAAVTANMLEMRKWEITDRQQLFVGLSADTNGEVSDMLNEMW
jgi:hypothetical protein